MADKAVAIEDELRRRAMFDDLTGALRREPTLLRLADARRTERTPGNYTAVLFIDVDDFKSVNDTRGHLAGDEILKVMVERVRTVVRSSDAVGRLGGDEFLVILDGIHSLDEAVSIAHKVRVACAAPVHTSNGAVTATLSIGVTLMSPDDTADTLISRADDALFAAKGSGRNRVVPVSG